MKGEISCFLYLSRKRRDQSQTCANVTFISWWCSSVSIATSQRTQRMSIMTTNLGEISLTDLGINAKCHIFVRFSPKSKCSKFYETCQVWNVYKNRYGGRRAFPYCPTRHGWTEGHDEADVRMHLTTKHSWGKTFLLYPHGYKLRLSPPWDEVAWTQFLLCTVATKREGHR